MNTNQDVLTDVYKIKKAFEACKNADDVAKKFETLTNDILDGRIKLDAQELNPKDRLGVHRGPTGVCRVTDYLKNLLDTNDFANLDRSLLTADFIKKVNVGALDDERTRTEYVHLFKIQLGMNEFSDVNNMTVYMERGKDRSPDLDKYYDTDITDELIPATAANCIDDNGIISHLRGNTEARDRLVGDPIATYANFEKFHNDHSFFYRIFHPVNYRNESKSLSRMKNVFTNFLKIPEDTLNTLKKEWIDKSSDPISHSYRTASLGKAAELQNLKAAADRRRECNKIRSEMEETKEKTGFASAYGSREEMARKLSDEQFKNFVKLRRKIITENVKFKDLVDYASELDKQDPKYRKMSESELEEIAKTHFADVEEKNLNEIREEYKNSLLDDVKPTENEEIEFTSKLGEKTAGYEKDAPTGNVNLINGNEKDLTEEKVAE